MIRLAIALLLAALPATAQDFRGLRPGMDASVLGAIGEPMEFYTSPDGAQAVYPLPFEHRLMVSYSTSGTIEFVASWAEPGASLAPRSSGLRIGTTTLRDFLDRLDLSEDHLAQQGLIYVEPFSETRFSLVYEIADAPEQILILDFAAAPERNRHAPPAERLDELGDALFTVARLALREDRMELVHPDEFPDGPRTAPIPFPLPIDEAFPSLIP